MLQSGPLDTGPSAGHSSQDVLVGFLVGGEEAEWMYSGVWERNTWLLRFQFLMPTSAAGQVVPRAQES